MITLAGAVIMLAAVALIMSLRVVEGDEHYGTIGWGTMIQSATNTFTRIKIDPIIEPDLILRNKITRRVVEIDVQDVLVWDVREWYPQTDATADVAGGENKTQQAFGGITKDNTANATNSATADSIAQGTRPGGSVAGVTGDALSGGASPVTVGETSPRHQRRWQYFGNENEEQTAVGQILHETRNYPQVRQNNSPYMVDGHTAHELLTAAHYHQWFDSNDLGGPSNQSLGADVRKMSIDIKELMFDREVLLSILDALVIAS